jgi:hypothetical protein
MQPPDKGRQHSLVVALVQGRHEVKAATCRHPPHLPQRGHNVVRLQRKVLQPWTLQSTNTALGTAPLIEPTCVSLRHNSQLSSSGELWIQASAALHLVLLEVGLDLALPRRAECRLVHRENDHLVVACQHLAVET